MGKREEIMLFLSESLRLHIYWLFEIDVLYCTGGADPTNTLFAAQHKWEHLGLPLLGNQDTGMGADVLTLRDLF